MVSRNMFLLRFYYYYRVMRGTVSYVNVYHIDHDDVLCLRDKVLGFCANERVRGKATKPVIPKSGGEKKRIGKKKDDE